ncbi:MAG: hypothetical protein NTX18_07610 [Cyanobium sp. LacPavin_0818_WC50_MAG_67_9]|nr:hypothetical protein [Cyanobium sp. LacPavin_0818_WC50_MAG_67_9]
MTLKPPLQRPDRPQRNHPGLLASLLGLVAFALPVGPIGAALAQVVTPSGTAPAGTASPSQTSAKEQVLLDKIRQLKAPRWKSFGSCRYDWSAWRIADGGVRTTTSICGSPEVTSKVAVHCDTLRVSHQSSQGTWGEWRLPLSQEESKSEGGEDLMVANLCANAKPIPAPPATPAATPAGTPKASSSKPAAARP